LKRREEGAEDNLSARPHLSQMCTTKYMPFTRKKSGFLGKKIEPIGGRGRPPPPPFESATGQEQKHEEATDKSSPLLFTFPFPPSTFSSPLHSFPYLSSPSSQTFPLFLPLFSLAKSSYWIRDKIGQNPEIRRKNCPSCLNVLMAPTFENCYSVIRNAICR